MSAAAEHIGSNLPLSFSPISLVVWPFVPAFLRRGRKDKTFIGWIESIRRSVLLIPHNVSQELEIDRHTQQLNNT